METANRGSGGWFDRSRTVAGPGFSRWMVPPAALCVHLCIGQAYAFSVFNLPMTKLLGITTLFTILVLLSYFAFEQLRRWRHPKDAQA